MGIKNVLLTYEVACVVNITRQFETKRQSFKNELKTAPLETYIDDRLVEEVRNPNYEAGKKVHCLQITLFARF
jgi:hypothetical protein